MGHIQVSELEYAPPGSDALFFDLGFTVSPGEHAALIGVNGVGKSTILRILAGELEQDEGSFSIGGTVLRMTQEVGMSHPGTTLRDMLIEVAPPCPPRSGRALRRGRAARARTSPHRARGSRTRKPDHWGDLGGYELEAQWEARRSQRSRQVAGRRLRRPGPVGELAAASASGWCSISCFDAGADVLLLDEPDNYLDVPTRAWLEDRLQACPSTS